MFAPYAVFSKKVIFIKIYCKMACCLLVGTKSGRLKYKKKTVPR